MSNNSSFQTSLADEIQILLDQNSEIIKSILKFQNDGKIMESMIYQTRLQSNLTKIENIQKEIELKNGQSVPLTPKNTSYEKMPFYAQLSKFVAVVQRMGVKNITSVAEALEITPENVVKLSLAYASFLRRQNRISEAQQIANELEINGIHKDNE